MASYALAPPCAQRTGKAKPIPVQAKLEVGPSHDRFEAEADRVAQSVLSSTGPSSPPPISPLGSGSAVRKPLQREEARPIGKREEDRTHQQKEGLTQILQPKSNASSSLDDLKKGGKGTAGKAQAKGNPSPKARKEDEKVQKKGLDGPSARIQAKADPRPREDEKVQKKPLSGQVLQPKASPRPKDDQKAQKKAAPSSKPKQDEKKAQKKALSGARLQAKANPRPTEDETKKAQKKSAVGAVFQAKSNPRPKEDETKKAQKKPSAGPTLQPKANPRPTAREDQKKVQKKSLTGTLQRDDVDDDTIAETSIQTKRMSTAQREVVPAKAALETEEKEEPKKQEPAPVQRAAQSADGFTAPSSVESGVAAMQGGGEPLSADVRSDLEPRFGRDLSGVRVHQGSRAGELSNSVQARAFTIGQDIFFGAGQFQPSTSGGRALLAHELTHTIQQQGGSSRAQKSRIQRAKKAKDSSIQDPNTQAGKGAAGKAGETEDPKRFELKNVGELAIDGQRKVARMKSLPVPKLGKNWKGAGPGSAAGAGKPTIGAVGAEPWLYKGKTARGSVTARRKWLDHWKSSPPTGLVSVIGSIMDKNKSGIDRNGQDIGYLRLKNPQVSGRNFLLIGTKEELAKSDEILLPIWNREGDGALFDVDHIHELQLGGADDFSNFWLLDQGTNRSSGSNIAKTMKDDFTQLVNAAEMAGAFEPDRLGTEKPDWGQIRDEATNPKHAWQVEYLGIRKIDVGGTEANWSVSDVDTGKHAEQLIAMKKSEIMEKGLIYAANPTKVTATIFAMQSGGFFRTVNFKDPLNVKTTDKLHDASVGTGQGAGGNQFYKGLAVAEGGFTMTLAPPEGEGAKQKALLGSAKELAPDTVIATIVGQPFPASKKVKSDPIPPIPVKWRPEFGYGGYADTKWINEKMARLSIEGASPIEVHEAGLTPQGELFANGEIIATKALFPNLKIPIFLRGNEIFISFPIPTDKLNLGPVHVTEAAIDIGYGLKGLFLGGHAGIVVDHVGKGTIEARKTSDDTLLKGQFIFDLDFLEKPTAEFSYSFATDALELGLKTGIKKGTLPGVESGNVEGKFSRESISLTGSLNLAAPLTGSVLTLGYTPEQGIVIAADDLPLPIAKIPGVEEAKLSAKVTINPDDGEWHVSGAGSAKFNKAPATGTLLVALDGSMLTITGTAAFQQGIASGSVTVTATNAQLDQAGQPIQDKVSDTFSVWGSGTASLKFGILTGTAGLKLNPDGSVIIDGEIALPPTHEVFAKKSYEKELIHFKPPEFPIWGISIAGYGIGIMGFVDAILKFDASVGPGTLNDTKVKVTFALDKPEEAVVDGTAAFVVPAEAGFTVDIGGGLVARAAVGYVKGRVGLDARLGLVAQARADVGLHWSQMEGLSLNASAHAEAHPRFDVGVNASVTAGVDLLLTEIEHTWGPWRKQLGSFGPEMAVGITAPIAWSEKTGLDFSTDKIEIQKPDIDFAATMKDAFLELV